MQIQAITPHLSFAGVKKQNKFNSTDNFQKLSYTKDSFEKQNSEILFTGLRKNTNSKSETRKEDNLGTSLKNVTIKGMPFLLALATSAAMVKMGEGAKDLLLDENGYLSSANGVKSDLINIDKAKGIIEFAGTGIELDASKYDVVDIDNGIFRNYDGSVDIDLANNKFIDREHGIFVDPVEKISAILDGNKMQSMAIPNFTGYQTWPYPVITRSDLTLEPEKSPFKKASDFIKGLFKKDSMPEVENMQDIFGNEIITAKDADGDTYLASYLKREIDQSPVFADFRTLFGREAAVEELNGARLQNYIQENHPDFETSFGTRTLVYEGGRHATGGIGDYKKVMESLESRYGKEYLKGLDIDGDGKISKQELANWIKSLDKDGDGKTTLKEALASMDIDGSGDTSLGEIIKSLDLDGDGKTTIAEIFKSIVAFFRD